MPTVIYGCLEQDCCYRCARSYMKGPDRDDWYDLACDLHDWSNMPYPICFDYRPICTDATMYIRSADR